MAIPNKTATEILMQVEKSKFQSEIWSKELLKQYKKTIEMMTHPKRSAGAQMLRDAALGHPEYEKWPENYPTEITFKTTTLTGK